MAVPQVATIVQARTGSERLPRKVLAVIAGQTMLGRVLTRAERIGFPVCVATPDDELVKWCAAHGWRSFQGSEDDVLERYAQAAQAMKADHVVRVTADCPHLDVEAAQLTVQEHLWTGADFTHHEAEGRAVQVIKTSALQSANRLAPRDVRFFREHPDEWILHNPGRYTIHKVKFSVDTWAELETARRRAEWHAQHGTPR